MHYLGVDIGSSYTKLTVIDNHDEVTFQQIIKTLNRNKDTLSNLLKNIHSKYTISSICATGYGREHFKEAHLTKTELHCASVAVSKLYPIDKTIIDIGGEDIKVIKSLSNGRVEDFYMNTKCAAGTGTFITEVAEKAEIDVSMMSALALSSTFNSELNSFCTVFAKTEIVKWIFDEVPIQDIARGIYISIVNRIAKLNMDKNLPVYLVGGVIAYHPYLKVLLQEKFKKEVIVPKEPQLINSFGAALVAKNYALTTKTA
ncbi:MAG: acyl-CoA dehydratase activase [Bacteroidia bacterium]